MNPQIKRSVMVGVASLLAVLPLFDVTHADSWIVPAAVAIALVVAAGHLLIRIRVPGPLVVLAQLAVLVLWLGALVAGDVAWLGFIPNPEWAGRLVDVFGAGTAAINTYAAPIPVGTGIIMLVVGGAGVIAVLVHTLTIGLRQVVLTGVPIAGCYALVVAVLPDGPAWWWFVPPAMGYLALLTSDSRTRVAAWGRSASPSAAHSGVPETDSLIRNGRRVGAVALVTALAVPALVPALSQGILQGAGTGGSGGRTIRTDNPIVDLQRSLSRPDNVEVLRYRSETPQGRYIRTVALDVFDGELWKTSERPVPEEQQASSGLPQPPGLRMSDVSAIDYDIDITDNYISEWLPMPYPAQQVDIEGDWRFDVTTLDVVAGRDNDTSGMSYTVRSLDVVPTREALQAAGTARSDLDTLTELPDDLPDVLAATAASITANANDDWARAAALQDWFRRDGGFTYDDTFDPGQSNSALEQFLADKRGFCVQFAATMAIMARSLDIPARVAVGYTPGDRQGDGSFLVRAHDAHAWPELYFEGVGWTRFEPTPSSRTGIAPDWTRTPEDAGTPGGNPSPRPTTAAPTSSASGGAGLDDNAAGGIGAGDGTGPWPLILLAVLGVAAVASLPRAIATLYRRRRWSRAGEDDRRRAEAGWADLRDGVIESGLPWDAAATPRSAGVALASDAGLAGEDRVLLGHVVDTVERARYSRRGTDTDTLSDDVGMIRRRLLTGATWPRRVRAYLWPATLRDARRTGTDRLVDGLDWLDEAGTRLRLSITKAVRAGIGR